MPWYKYIALNPLTGAIYADDSVVSLFGSTLFYENKAGEGVWTMKQYVHPENV